MRRTTLGILAVFLVVVGFIVALRGPEDGSAAGFAGGCVRVGLVLAALWLAWPQIIATIKRLPGWLTGWLLRGEKSTGAASSTPAKNPVAAKQPPPVRPKRPRRRSQQG